MPSRAVRHPRKGCGAVEKRPAAGEHSKMRNNSGHAKAGMLMGTRRVANATFR